MPTPGFSHKVWKDQPDHTTPISAAAIEDLEDRVTQFAFDTASTLSSHFKGVWSSGTAYSLGDGVSVGTINYISTVAGTGTNTNHNPVGDDGSHWTPAIPSSVVTGTSPIIASKFLLPSGSDDSAAFASAITSFAPFAFPVVVLGPGTFLWNTQVPALLRATPCKIIGAGAGKTTIKLSASAPRFLDFGKVADYDTFNDIEISDLTVDANSLTGKHHVVIGEYAGGGFLTRINIARLTVRRVRTINVVTDITNPPTNYRPNIYINPVCNLADSACSITDVLIEDVDFNGGNIGISIGYATNDGHSSGSGTWDRIVIRRGRHDHVTLNQTATASQSENIQIGAADTGGAVSIEDFFGYNSGDLGIGILNARAATVERCTIQDARTGAFQAMNYNTSPPNEQMIKFHKCHAKIVNTQPTGIGASAFPGTGFYLNGPGTGPLGHIVLDSCSYDSRSPILTTNGAAISIADANPTYLVQKLTIKDFSYIQDAVNTTLSANANPVGMLVSVTGKCVINVDGFRSIVKGAVALAGHTFSYKDVWINPQANGDIEMWGVNHEPTISLTGLTAQTCYGIHIGPTSIPGNVTVTGNTTNTSNVISGLSAADIAKVTPGDPLTGTGIPANATVGQVNIAAGSFTMGNSGTTQNATATNTGVTITVTPLACIRGAWRFSWQGDQSGDTAPFGANVQKWTTPGAGAVSGAFFAIAGHLSFDGSDCTRMPSGSAGNGNTIGNEVFDTGNAANAMPLVTYKGIRSAGARAMATASQLTLTAGAGAGTVTNNRGWREQVWFSALPTALTVQRGTTATARAVVATAGPFYMEPGDVLVATMAGASTYWRIPADM